MRRHLKLRESEWWGISVGVDDEIAFVLASERLGVEVEQLEVLITGGAKLFRIREDNMDLGIVSDKTRRKESDIATMQRLGRAQKKVKKLEKQIASIGDLVLLARGCKKHPAYRGGRKSKTDCEICANLYRLAQLHLK